MAIQLDTTRLASASQTSVQDAGVQQTTGKATAALLGGSAVTVTNGATTDLEALVARLKNETARAKFSLLLTSLASISQSLNEAQKRVLEQGLALSEKLETLEKALEGLTGEEAQTKADMLLLQAKIDQLTKQIEQAVKDGKAHNELVAEQKEAREELDAKKRTLEDTQGKIAEAKNEIGAVKGQISAIVKSIGENQIKTIANELAALAEPEKAERPAEAAKEAEKEAVNDPLAAIRESLAKIERDITETIAENRIETV